MMYRRLARSLALLAFAVSMVATPAAVFAQDEAPSTEEAPADTADSTADADEASGDAAEGSGAEDGSGDGVVGSDESAASTGFASKIDSAFSGVVGAMASVLFFEPLPGMPFIVVWLVIGAVFFTFYFGFVNIRAFRHAIDVLRGRYDNPDDEGEVSHFQALSSALSATVGLGNIAGVAVAVTTGGPGAIFWMLVAAFFGMTAKFAEVTLGQKYRIVDEEGRVLGGPMRYLEAGLTELGLAPLGKVLAVIFAIFCIGGSFGGGNMFQANQAYQAFDEFFVERFAFHIPAEIFGLVMMVAVGVVIFGGIKSIAKTAERIVPLMVGMYLTAAIFVIITNIAHLPDALGQIFNDAFTGSAVGGGFLGVLIVGFQRAAFSNEAGIGSASIAHSAAKTDEPIREGLVGLIEPFIDTILVCLATALVIVISGVHEDPALADVSGAVLTAKAFETVISWFPLLLSISIVLFAYSTMISWSYYGERSWTKLFGAKSSVIYRGLFLVFIFIGTISTLDSVITFSDLMILSMAFPNILGLYLLAGKVKKDLNTYMDKLNSGQFKTYDGSDT